MPSWIIVSYLICSAAIIFAIVRLFARGNKPYAKAGVMVYLVYTLLFAAIWIFSLPVPSFLIFLTMLTALACCFCGYYLDLYNHSPYVFDRSLHAFGAFSFSLTAYCIIAGVTQPGGSLLFRALFVFCIGNTLGAVFELLEAAHDSKKNVPVKGQKGLQDTNMDMLFNAIGSLLAGVFSYFFPLP